MGREDQRSSRPEQPCIDLRHADPLEVHEVGAQDAETDEPERVLERLHDKAGPSPFEPRRDRIEELPHCVTVGVGDRPEPEARCDQLDLHSRACECPCERAVVGWGVRGGIGDHDSHECRLE